MAVPFVGYFYDIESLSNVFTLVNSKFSDVNPNDVTIDVYYLVDDDDKFHLKQAIDAVPVASLNKMMKDKIILRNPNLSHRTVTFNFLNLADIASREKLATEFGLTASNDTCQDKDKPKTDTLMTKYRLACDTDNDLTDFPEYYLLGYNSYNYDTTMLALFFEFIYNHFKKDLSDNVTAFDLRKENDILFSDKYRKNMPSYLYQGHGNNGGYSDLTANKMRRNMIRTGRHLDVARLNEKQQHVALKKILGMLGFQILESDKLKGKTWIETLEEFLELIAYNVSDTVNLRMLFLHPAYKAQFDLKRSLLYEYKDTVYMSCGEIDKNSPTPYKPCISPNAVKKMRLTPDSSSAKFAAAVLSPYGNLPDLPAVSYDFPDEKMAQVLNIPRRNILEESKDFFYQTFTQPELRKQFDEVYKMYKSIEGKNFNALQDENKDYVYGEPASLRALVANNTLLPYFDAHGDPTSCFVIFSTGGIHGAEYNVKLFRHAESDYVAAYNEYLEKASKLQFIKDLYNGDAKAARNATYTDDKGKTKPVKTVIYTDGTDLKISDYAKYKKKDDSYSWIEIKEPEPLTWYRTDEPGDYAIVDPNFERKPIKLNETYTFTSADESIHEDFTSYYPKLLMAMNAFFNPMLGEDRYSKIFDNKTLYGKYMKDPNRSKEERDYYKTARAGTKLILNSASGAGDTDYDVSIKMNNRIISMRIIGQLFSWRIGQAQVIAGARVPSTNTDGLYTADLDETTNNTILSQVAANIGVEIEPEKMYLISKDSNNRIEYTLKNGKPTATADGDFDWGNLDSINTSGGDLGCSGGPDPTKSLAHPAIVDWVLSRYLIAAASNLIPDVGLDKEFNREYAMKLIHNPIPEIMPKKPTDKPLAELLKYYQNILAASASTVSYPFAYTNPQIIDLANTPGYFDYDAYKASGEIQVLQKYNRIFVMKDGTPNCVHVQKAALRKITPAMLKTRQEEEAKLKASGGVPNDPNNPLAKNILLDNGLSQSDLSAMKSTHDTAVVKLTGFEPEWYLRVDNRDLYELSDQDIVEIINNLDLDKYIDMVGDKFTNNWLNRS